MEAVVARNRSVRDRYFIEYRRSLEASQERARLNQTANEIRYLDKFKALASKKNAQLNVLRSLEEMEAQLLQAVSHTESLHNAALSKLTSIAKP